MRWIVVAHSHHACTPHVTEADCARDGRSSASRAKPCMPLTASDGGWERASGHARPVPVPVPVPTHRRARRTRAPVVRVPRGGLRMQCMHGIMGASDPASTDDDQPAGPPRSMMARGV